MGPRAKKQRSVKAKESSTSPEGEREIAEGGGKRNNEETETSEEVHETEVDNGGDEAPPLKKTRGRTNVRKAPVKGRGGHTADDEENLAESVEKLADSDTVDDHGNVSGDHDDEEAVPVKKGRGRQKKVMKDDAATKEVSNGEGDTKEDSDVAAPNAKKGRGRKKKTEDEPEVMPKKKDRGAKKNEATVEDATVDESTSGANAEELKQKVAKREKKQPIKKPSKAKKDQDEEVLEEEEVNGKKENGQALEELAEAEEAQAEEGGGDAKPAKKTARGKAAAKADVAPKKKPAGHGKKAAKGEALAEDDDVALDGKKLRVLVEHCKS